MSFWRNQSGNIAILFAVGFAVSAMVAAVAVDGAALYHERRSIQNAVDLAAISAAADPGNARAIATAVLADAGLTGGALTTTVGNYTPDPAKAPAARFVAGSASVNAVTVQFERPGTLHFARNWAPEMLISASATATVTPEVALSIGSRLASLQGGIANVVLNQLLGTNVALTLVDYNGLAGVRLDLLRFLDALAIELNVTAGTYNDLLGASASHKQIARAIAAVVTGADRLAANVLANAIGGNGAVPLGKLFALGGLGHLGIGSGGGDDLLADLGALDLVAASAALSNGDRQIDLALGASVPGLVSLSAKLLVGEPPQGGRWFAVGPIGTVVRTAQVRLRVEASVLGTGALLGDLIHLPLYLEAAHAEAIVGSATCPSPAAPRGSATILTRPGVVRLVLGEVGDPALAAFNTPPVVSKAKLVEVKLLGLTVLKVLASALVEIAAPQPIPLTFSSADISAGTVRTARTTGMVSSLIGSLLGNLVLEIPVLGLGLSLSGVGPLLKAILTPLTPTLDLVLDRLLESLGLSLGEADVRVYGVRCTHAVLVG